MRLATAANDARKAPGRSAAGTLRVRRAGADIFRFDVERVAVFVVAVARDLARLPRDFTSPPSSDDQTASPASAICSIIRPVLTLLGAVSRMSPSDSGRASSSLILNKNHSFT